MIILAAAIILSLSNSGIISKANKAKTDSDTSNLKEYVNTLRAEWELMTAEEKKAAASSFEEYANKKLEENGYKGAVGADGEVYSNLNENVMAAIKAGIKVGDTIAGYTIAETTYTTSGEENTAPNSTETDPASQTVTANTALTWKYLGINANGELEIIADLGTTEATDNTKVKLSGKGGYLKGADILNTVCKELYSKERVGIARSMNIDDITKILVYNGPKGSYFDVNGREVETADPLVIEKIAENLGSNLTATQTPDGKDINIYKSDFYCINSSNDSDRITSDVMKKDLVYKGVYWVATPCTTAYFCNGRLCTF